VLCLQSCNAQTNESKVSIDYIKMLEKEIESTKFSIEIFSDTVLFEVGNIKKYSTGNPGIKSNWAILKKTFKGTDFVINHCNKELNKKCFEIKSHRSIYLVRFNESNKIMYVKEVKLKLPSNIPPD